MQLRRVITQSTRKQRAIAAAGAGVAALGIAGAFVVGSGSPTLSEPPVAAFGVLTRAQTSSEAATVRSFAAVAPSDISGGRLLTTDPDGAQIFLTRSGADVCLAVTIANDPVAHGPVVKMNCDPASRATDMWMEYGADNTSYLVTAVPAQYAHASVSTSGKKLVANDTVVLVKTHGMHADKVTLTSATYKPLVAGSPQ